jgi:hypothetical protein
MSFVLPFVMVWSGGLDVLRDSRVKMQLVRVGILVIYVDIT